MMSSVLNFVREFPFKIMCEIKHSRLTTYETYTQYFP